MAFVAFRANDSGKNAETTDRSCADRLRSGPMRLCGLRVALRAVGRVLADVERFGFLTLHSLTHAAGGGELVPPQAVSAVPGAAGDCDPQKCRPAALSL